jgi:hypothetical protein
VLFLARKFRKLFAHSDLALYLSLVSFPALPILIYFIGTKWVVAANITLWLFLIMPCLFFGVLLQHMTKRWWTLILAILLCLAFFAGNLLLQYHPNVLYAGTSAIAVELPEYKNAKIVESAEWLKGYSNTSAVLIGDQSIFDIYSAYYGFVVSPVEVAKQMYAADQEELEKRFLQRDIYVGAYAHTASRERAQFLVINRDLLTNPSYHFQVQPEDLAKFDNSTLLRKVYDNGVIAIYENTVSAEPSLIGS